MLTKIVLKLTFIFKNESAIHFLWLYTQIGVNTKVKNGKHILSFISLNLYYCTYSCFIIVVFCNIFFCSKTFESKIKKIISQIIH